MAPDLPVEYLSVRAFVQKSKDLLAANQEEFVKFTLEGIHDGRQYVVDALRHRMDQDEPFTAMRDYDSLLGIAPDIMVHEAITVFPVAKREDTLSTDIHLKHEFETTEGTIRVPVHKVPNLRIAKWGTHNSINMFLPELYADNRTPYLTQEEYRLIYENGIRPAVQQLAPDAVAEWPAEYQDEIFRARGSNGRLAFTSKELAGWRVHRLGEAIRQALARSGSTLGTGLVFLHQIRGVKHSTPHRAEPQAARAALTQFLHHNRLSRREISEKGVWYIDVGVELRSSTGNCLAWRTDSHRAMVEWSCELSEVQAARITRMGSSKYARDLVSHLPAVSGCRITTGREHGPHDVPYLQLYTTDKAVTYRPDGATFGKAITGEQVLKGKGPVYIESLCTLYNNNSAKGNAGHARIELRTSYFAATEVLVNLDEHLLRTSLVSINPSIWWALRTCRALSIKFILEWQMQGEPEFRADASALTLTAAAVWLLNGLHSAPDKGQSSRALMTSALPHIDRVGADPNILAYGTPLEDDDHESEDSTDSDSDGGGTLRTRSRGNAATLPAFPRGLIFLSKLRIGAKYPVPRLTKDPLYALPERAFRYFFNTTPEQLSEKFLQAGTVRSKHPNRISNRTRHTPGYYNWGQNPDGNIFDLAGKGAELPVRPQDLGSDNEEEEGSASSDDENTGIDKFLTKLWYQFMVDVMEVGPNKRRAHEPAYIKLSAVERMRANEETYRTNLWEIFTDFQWLPAEDKEWRTIFNKFFPVKGHTRSGRVQNYPRAKYYPRWEQFKMKANFRTYSMVRKELFKRFCTLHWMPRAVEERIWWTKPDPKMFQSRGKNSTAPCPRILVYGPLAIAQVSAS